jgi:hypothetical protein
MSEYLETANITNPLLDTYFGLTDDILVIKGTEQLVVTETKLEFLEKSVQGPPGGTGPRGMPGEASVHNYVAGEILSGHRVVKLNNDNKAVYVSNSVLTDSGRVFGITIGASLIGQTTQIITIGTFEEPSWDWVVDLPIYLGTNGQLTQLTPTYPSAKFLVVVGVPLSSTSIYVNIRFPIILK